MIAVNKIKYLAKIENYAVKPFCETKKYYSTGAVDGDDDYEEVTYYNKPSRANLCVKENSIIFAKMKDTDKTTYVTKEMENNIYSTGFASLKAKTVDDKYLYYLLSNDEFISQKNIQSYGTTQFAINEQNLLDIKLHYNDNIETQKKIANFLDNKCSEIDSLTKDIESQIATLEEYKKSVVTEAVTKGLNPNIETKDSGVEWIGEIPNGWSVSKLGNVLSLCDEKNYKPLEEVNLISLYTDKGVVQHSDLEETSGNKAQNADGYKIVHKNNIVVNIILAWMGAMGISNYEGVTSPAYDVYKINENKIVPHYCHYILRTPALAGECFKYGRGIMMMRWRTYSSEFKKIKMPLPPIDEQNKIANFLDNKCSEIDLIISEKQKQLSTLNEYKKSLIYEYVTGKKEVA